MLEKIRSVHTFFVRFGIVITTLLTLFLFWNITTEFYESPKFIALAVFLMLMLILSTIKYVLEGKIVLTITPLDLPFLLLLVVAIISTFTSTSYYVALLGNAPRFFGGLISITILVLFYYLMVNNLRSIKDIKPILYSLLLSGIVLSLISILSYFGIKIFPFNWAQGLNFTPTGDSFSTSSVLVLLTPFILMSLIRSSNPTLKIANAIILTLFGVAIILIGSIPVFIALGASIFITLFYNFRFFTKGLRHTSNQLSILCLIVPLLVVALIGLFSYVKMPDGMGRLSNNIFYQQSQNFPRKVQLPFNTSWNIAISTFRDAPLWGTGPSTFLFNFTEYKPLSFNSSNFWNINFDEPFNEYLLVLASLGGVGLISYLILTAVFLSLAIKVLRNRAIVYEDGPTALSFKSGQIFANRNDDIRLGLAISGILFFILLALHVSTLVTFLIGLLIISAFFAVNQQFTKSIQIRLGALKTANDSSSFDILPFILIIFMIIVSGFGSYKLQELVRADIYHRQALELVSVNNGIEAYNQLVKAETLNPYNDLYRTDIAQTNFAIANAIAIAKGPTESSPSGSLTDQDKANIQAFLEQAIKEGRNATTISPRNANNWQVLGNIYKQIAGVAQNSIQFSLDAYGRGIQKDPINPMIRLNVGGIYYSVKNYDLAIRFFTDAINLKPDYANAYYNLSIALRDKGDLPAAQAAAEQLVSILQVNTENQDYKVASEYLSDLKSRIATGSAQQSQITPPAAKETSPLQSKKLPKVIDLPKAQNISTPEAVQKQEEEK